MQDVFSQVISDASQSADQSLLYTCLREYSVIPGGAVLLRWEAMRAWFSHKPFFRCRWEGPLSRKEFLLAMAVFVAPAVTMLAKFVPTSVLTVAGPLVVVFMLTVLFAGLIKGFPRWSLPYLGLVLSAFSFVFLFNRTIDLFSSYQMIYMVQPDKWSESERLLLQVFSAGMMWLSLFVFIFLVIGVTVLLKRFKQFYWRLRWDWTQVSFILYSGATLGLILLFDQDRKGLPYLAASLVCLAIGAWLYLRSPKGWQRLFVLLAGITAAVFVSAAGRWFTAADLNWSIPFLLPTPENVFWLEAERTLLEWGWLVLILTIPGIMSLFPPPEELELT